VDALFHPGIHETQHDEPGAHVTPLGVALVERRQLFEEREMSKRSIRFEHCSLRWKGHVFVVPHDCAVASNRQVRNRDGETSDL
jgi:hypothetical protein